MYILIIIIVTIRHVRDYRPLPRHSPPQLELNVFVRKAAAQPTAAAVTTRQKKRLRAHQRHQPNLKQLKRQLIIIQIIQ